MWQFYVKGCVWYGFSDYIPGSATALYRRMVDEAAEIAERQKQRVDALHHERIDYLLDRYAQKLAENMNESLLPRGRVRSAPKSVSRRKLFFSYVFTKSTVCTWEGLAPPMYTVPGNDRRNVYI